MGKRITFQTSLAVFALLLAHQASAFAQARTVSSGGGDRAQYLFVVDDSGSMRAEIDGVPAADPNRLAVFAVRSMVEMLRDTDSAAVVRLNDRGQAGTSRAVADAQGLRPLNQPHRRAINEALLGSPQGSSITGQHADQPPISAYDGGSTPCGTALLRAQQALNAAHEPGLAQNLFILTDGSCDSSALGADALLGAAGIESHQEGLLRIYVLRFRGRTFTPELATLAERTGGAVIQVAADSPSRMLGPFADALSRSQGHRSQELSPREARLSGYLGAESVRLLAVAPDSGSDLVVRVRGGGTSSDTLSTGLHQYREEASQFAGAAYRFAVVEISAPPGDLELEVLDSGGNAVDDWSVVAVPKYDLHVRFHVVSGDNCDGPPASYAPINTPICSVVSVVNSRGEVLGDELAARISAATLEGDALNGTSREMSRPGAGARFVAPLGPCRQGAKQYFPRVTLEHEGEESVLRGSGATIDCIDQSLTVTPASIHFDDVVPGFDQSFPLVFSGGFSASNLLLTLDDTPPPDNAIPGCVHFELAGTEFARGVGAVGPEISGGHEAQLRVRVDPYCGADPVEATRTTQLRFSLQDEQAVVDSVEVTLALQLRVEGPDQANIELTAGDAAEVELLFGGTQTRAVTMTALIPTASERRGWPNRQLTLGFVDPETGELVTNDDGEPAAEFAYALEADGSPLTLRATSRSCCASGTYETELRLVPRTPSAEAFDVPVRVTVESAGFWRCRGAMVLKAIALLLLLLLLWMLWNIFRNSHFLSTEALARKLVPLELSDTGVPIHASVAEARRIAKRSDAFSVSARLRAWLAANPLKLALGRNAYHESVRLNFQQGRSHFSISLHQVRDLDPDRMRGRVWAVAGSTAQSVALYCVVDSEGLVAGMRNEEVFVPEPEDTARAVSFRGQWMWADADNEFGGAVGWNALR